MARRQFIVLLFFWAATSAVILQLDLFEQFDAWTRQHEHWNADEVVMVAIVGLFVVALYAWWRYAHAQIEHRRLLLTQQALADTNERYSSLFDYHPDPVFALSIEGRFIAANDACGRVSGYSPQQLVDMHFTDLLAPDGLADFAVAFAGVLERVPKHLEGVILHREGYPVEISVTGLPIVVEDEVVGVYGIAVDVTETNRTRRELARAQADAEAANHAKSLFLANVSHEIRTPLTSVLGTTEILQDTDLDPLQAKFVDTLHRSGERLLVLVEDILDFSKIEAGQLRVYPRKFDLHALILEVAALHRPAAIGMGLAFECILDPDLPRGVTADPDRIAQILTNLVDNAIKFTDSGVVSITAGVQRKGNADELQLTVRDSGIGIHADQHDSLFEAFSQGDPSITRKYGGTGLGLAITRQLVQAMSGTINVHSVPGEGSAFSVCLPLHEDHEPATVRLQVQPTRVPSAAIRVNATDARSGVRSDAHG